MAQTVKCLSAMQETGVQSLGWEDPLEKEMVTHSGILASEVPWTAEPGGLQSIWLQRAGHNVVTKQQQLHNSLPCSVKEIGHSLKSPN